MRASRKGSEEIDAIEITLKDHEADLPGAHHFFDKDGHSRTKMRTAWWRDPAAATYSDYFLEPIAALAGQPVDVAALPNASYYRDETPVFFGHYWLGGEPQLLTPHAVCLDYSWPGAVSWWPTAGTASRRSRPPAWCGREVAGAVGFWLCYAAWRFFVFRTYATWVLAGPSGGRTRRATRR